MKLAVTGPMPPRSSDTCTAPCGVPPPQASKSSPANVIRQDPVKRDLLYLGTDRGVYVSTDGGEQWNVLGKGLPTVYAQDLVIQTKEDYAVISTHGRGCWVLDIRDLRRN